MCKFSFQNVKMSDSNTVDDLANPIASFVMAGVKDGVPVNDS